MRALGECRRVVAGGLLVLCHLTVAAQAQEAVVAGRAGQSAAAPRPSSAVQGPPPPTLPETVARDEQGRATIRAVRIDAPLRIDGRLDEPLYSSVLPISDFIQTEPKAGAPATEKTEIWIAFDNDNVYVS